jgi:hypothetical protein
VLIEVTPLLSCCRLPAPETAFVSVNASSRSMASVPPLLIAPLIEPVAPPSPSWRIPPSSIVVVPV